MIQSQIPCHLRSNNTHQSPEQATREMYVWHLTPSWNSLYFVTLAARVLPTAAGPCPLVGAGLLGPATAASSGHLPGTDAWLKKKFS